MAKSESWLKRNIVAMVAAGIAAIAAGGVWYNASKPTPAPVVVVTPVPAPAMTATATSGGTAVNATEATTVKVGAGAVGQAGSGPHVPAPTAAGTPGAMHASADTGGTAVNATGSAQVTTQKTPADAKP